MWERKLLWTMEFLFSVTGPVLWPRLCVRMWYLHLAPFLWGLDPFVHHHIQLNQRGGAVSVYKCNRFLCVKFVSFNVTEFILMSSSSFLATSLGFSISCHLQTVRILLLLSNVDSSYLLFFSDCQLRTSKTMWNKKWWQWTSLPCSWSQKKCF